MLKSYYAILLLLICSCAKEDNKQLYTLMPSSVTGINFVNIIKETSEFNILTYEYLYHGAGVSVGDINNDGLLDIYFTGNLVGSHLYLNEGNFKFKEIAKSAGVFAEGHWNTGTTMADINGDGLLDIYVCRSAAKNPKLRKNLLFINNGNLTFTESASKYGVDDPGYSMHSAFFDYDRDGDLDLYVLNHSTQEYAGFDRITPMLKKKNDYAISDKLYENMNGHFVDVSEEAGLISNVLGFGLGVAVSDVNNDGWLDIYISNDYNEQDYLYINNKDRTFTESLENLVGHTSQFSMGSDTGDLNNDGYPEIITLDMLPEDNYRQKLMMGPDNYEKFERLVNSGFYYQSMRNMLQLNNDGQSFSEVGQFSGISKTDWSWACLIEDYDNDGLQDIFITNGYKRDITNMDFINYAVNQKLLNSGQSKEEAIFDLLKNIPSAVVPNYIFRNNGNLKFEKMNDAWGINKSSLSNGAAYADLDNDGDLDLIVNNINESAFIYRNNSETNGHNYLKVKLNGTGNNKFAIGAKVSVYIKGKMQNKELITSRGYQSSIPPEINFGIGRDSIIDSLQVRWPNGLYSSVPNPKPNTTIVINQDKVSKFKLDSNFPTKKPIFYTNNDSLIVFRHTEANYNDFNRERLLPRKYSNLGPATAKGDFNGDGLEDIFLGGAHDSISYLYKQNRDGSFTKTQNQSISKDYMAEDVGALFFDADNDGDLDLYVVSGSNEVSKDDPILQDRLYVNLDGKGNFKRKEKALPKMLTSGLSVVAGDFDKDGDLDLFVGGRITPGEYPNAPRSYILENDGHGIFSDKTSEINPVLVNVGMVSDALWTDFDSDGFLDLIVVGEWMPIKLFKNNNGKLEDISSNSGILDSEGWWNTITEGDFNNDGKPDYILGNFGTNSQLNASSAQPVSLYVSDFDNNGSIDPILTSYIQDVEYPVYSRDDMIAQLSRLKAKFTSYDAYAKASISDVLTEEEIEKSTKLRAKRFESIILENLGNSSFKIKPLPKEAQFSTVNSILVEDFNMDGNLDVLLGGNFLGARVQFGKNDANRGLLLWGDGTNNFRSAPVSESGLNITGQVNKILSIKSFDSINKIIFIRNNNDLLMYNIDEKP